MELSRRPEYFWARLLFDLPESMFDWEGVIWTMWWFGSVIGMLARCRFSIGMVNTF